MAGSGTSRPEAMFAAEVIKEFLCFLSQQLIGIDIHMYYTIQNI
jgi:hypothetical protein